MLHGDDANGAPNLPPAMRSFLWTGEVEQDQPTHVASRVCVNAGSHMAVRRSSFLQSCMCMPKTEEDDPLDEL